ncbi:MAG: hypothetical protein GY953_49930, partial [bacterium]|nr:hypothetical protein [bacterium]
FEGADTELRFEETAEENKAHVRNEAFDAKNFFDPADSDKPPFKRWQYGFAVGGPVKKNKSFLFGDVEWTDVRESSTLVSTVPSLAFRNGDFTGGDIIHDPDTWDGTERQPFPNNRIPDSRLDPVTQFMKDWWPDPQNAAKSRNFVFTPPRKQDFHKWDIRFDHNLTATDNFFLRWSSQEQNIAGVPRYPATEFGSLSRGAEQNVTSNNAVVAYSRVWSPTLVSTFRLGWNYLDTDVETHLDIPGDVNAQIGLKGFDTTLRGSPELNVSGYTAIGTNTFRPNLIQSQTRQFSADSTATKGRHAIKFGAQIWWLQSFIDNPQRSKGTITFDGRFTERSPSNRGGTGDAVADLLLGNPREMQGSS